MIDWNPIETAPFPCQPILLWARAWKHPFVGQVVDGQVGQVFLIDPTFGSKYGGDSRYFAEFWAPLTIPTLASTEKDLASSG